MPSTRHSRTQSLTPDIEVLERLSEPFGHVKSNNQIETERSTVMADNSATQNGPDIVQAGLNYLVYNGEKPVSYVTVPGEAPIKNIKIRMHFCILTMKEILKRSKMSKSGHIFFTMVEENFEIDLMKHSRMKKFLKVVMFNPLLSQVTLR